MAPYVYIYNQDISGPYDRGSLRLGRILPSFTIWTPDPPLTHRVTQVGSGFN